MSSLEEAYPAQSWDRPVQPGGYTVTGGVGGISFTWTELLRGAYELEETAGSLGVVADELTQIGAELIRRGDHLGPGHAAWWAVAECGSGAAAAERRFAELGAEVRTGYEGYAAAEESVLRRFIDAEGSLRNFELRLQPGDHGAVGPDGLGGGRRARYPEVAESDAWYHLGDESASWLFGEAADEGWLVPAPVTWTMTDESTATHYDGTLSSLIDRNHHGRMLDGRIQDGVIEILRVEDAESTRFVVSIPGTQGTSPVATGNPLDPTGIAEAMASDSRYITAGVMQALVAAGASTGSPVLLNGHSQGGIHAHAIAADPGFRARFDPQYVVTAGSPVANMALPGETVALSLEQEGDAVVHTDLRNNPDAPNRVTVNFTTRAQVPPGAEAKILDAHQLFNYSRKAEALESSEHPSVAPVLGGIAAFAPVGAKITSYKFRGQRHLGRPIAPLVPSAVPRVPSSVPVPSAAPGVPGVPDVPDVPSAQAATSSSASPGLSTQQRAPS